MLTKEQILTADDMPREEVQAPEWGGSVWVRGMTGFEFEQLQAATRIPDGTQDNKHFVPKMVALCTVDETGKSLFSLEDAEALHKKSPVVLQRIFVVAAKLSGMKTKDVDVTPGN